MRLHRIAAIAFGAAALFGSAATTHAAPFAVGDVFASVGGGLVRQYSAAGVLKDTLDTGAGGFTTGSAFDAAGNFYVTNFSNGSVYKFAGPADVHTRTTFASGISAAPESIAFDLAGNMYVGSADGAADIHKYDSAGNHLASFNVATTARGSDWIDLAADQKTMYYTSENSEIKRFDLSTNTQLTDFATLPGRPAFALRILGDGTVLVADSAAVYRVDSTSAVLNTYDDAGNDNWFALNLDPDGTSFWSGDFGTGELLKFDIATGMKLQTIDTGLGRGVLFGVSVFGEITQGGGCRVNCKVSEPGGVPLVALALVGAVAIRRRLLSSN